MQKKHVIIMIILASLMIQCMLFAGPLLSTNNTSQPAQPTISETPVRLAGAGGENPLVTNVLDGGGFEQTDSVGAPLGWDYGGSTYAVENASYTTLHRSGACSGQVLVQPSQQWIGGWSSLDYDLNSHYPIIPRPYLTQGISLDFYTYIVSNPAVIGSYYYARIGINCAVMTRYVYYYLSYRAIYLPGNDSDSVYFGLNTTMGSWQNLHRNVTYDYQSRFGVPQSDYFVFYLEWCVNSPNGGTEPTEAIIDDVSLQNRTADEFLLNGGFEDGDGSYWRGSGLYWPGYVYTTSCCTMGSRAANVTAKALGPNGQGYASISRYFSLPRWTLRSATWVHCV